MDIKINVLNEKVKMPEELLMVTGRDELLARILYNRGIRDAEAARQLLYEECYSPTGTSEFPGMKKAVDLILAHIKAGSLIAVYGDYDVDGVTSTALLLQCLKSFTPSVIYHVPDRFSEGYGMNRDVIMQLGKKGVSLVVTCDCGVSNYEEISLAKELGMEVVVTDHHNLPDILPPADAVLNPRLLPENHRAREISGCAMAYFVALAVLEHFGEEDRAGEYLDLVAMSLVADVVSLRGENRYLLKRALPKLFNTSRTGLRELFAIIEQNGRMASEEDIAFQIAPRINAAGRMETARLPVELLTGTDVESARELALKIDNLNRERKRLQQDIVEQASEMVENKKKNKTVLVLFNEYWHHGIIGIAAGKISETYGKPAILLSLKEDGTTVVGSARSIEGVDIYGLIKECSSKLLKFGGHTLAAGLSLKREDIEDFEAEIEGLAEKKYYIKGSREVNADSELALEQINEELYTRLLRIGPFGEGFEAPQFVSRQVSVISDRKIGKNHHIMVLDGENNTRIPAVKWFGDDTDYLGRELDVTYKIGQKYYRGKSEIQLTLDCLVETGGKSRDVFTGEFTDERGKDIRDILPAYGNAVVFYEGLEALCPIEGVLDRNMLRYNRKNSSLIFLSPPVNTLVFREVIALVNPKNVVINFSVSQDYSFKGFVTNLMGVIKYIINNEGGRSQLEFLSARLCVEDSLVRAALKYMKALGKLEYSIDDSEVCFSRCSRSPEPALSTAERNLKTALSEKNAYQQFIMRLETGRFKEYLK